MLKNNKAPSPGNIPAEALKSDIETSTQMLFDLLRKIWKEKYMVKLPKKGN